MIAERFPLTCPRCGQTAMLLRRRFMHGELLDLDPDDVELPDGSRPVRGDQVQCGVCDTPFDWAQAAWQAGALDE